MILLSGAIDAYIDENAPLREWAEQTIKSYRYRLQSFVEFLDDAQISVSTALTYENASRYFNWLQKRGYKPTTLYAKKQAFSAFWGWCHKRKLVQEALDMRLRKPDNPPVVFLTPDEAALIEQVALGGTNMRSIIHLRDQAAFALLDETGLPLRALSDLPLDAYDPEAQTLSPGKAPLLLSDHLCELLDHYLRARSIHKEI